MKFGAYFAYWEKEWDADYMRYCQKFADIGFDVLEVSGAGLYEMNEQQLIALKDEAARCGVKLTGCIGFSKACDVSSEDPEVRAAGIAYAKRLFDHMHIAGIDRLSGIIYSYWPFDYTQKFSKPVMRANALESVRILADYAAQYDILMNLEVVNRFEHPLLNTAAEAVAFAKDVDRPNVKILLDTFHMNIEEDNIPAAIRLTGDYLGHIHVGEANRKLPGQGSLDWRAIAAAVHDVHYDGNVVMEPFLLKGGSVGKDIKVWRDLSNGADEAKMDQMLADAVKFLHANFD